MSPQKPHKNHFVISIAGNNIDITIINIEEMAVYCRSRNRFANVVTEKKAYGELEKMNYALIMNYTKPKPRVVTTKSQQYLKVYGVLSEKYQGGLLIAEDDTLSDPIAELLCKSGSWENNDVDIMICRDSFSSVTADEIERANLLRISADPNLDPQIFIKMQDFFKEKMMTVMLCQFFANEQYDTVNRYMDVQNELYSQQGMSEYIDYYELNKQLAYFVYYDVIANKILNVDKQTVVAFIKKMAKEGIIPIPEAHILPFADVICL